MPRKHASKHVYTHIIAWKLREVDALCHLITSEGCSGWASIWHSKSLRYHTHIAITPNSLPDTMRNAVPRLSKKKAQRMCFPQAVQKTWNHSYVPWGLYECGIVHVKPCIRAAEGAVESFDTQRFVIPFLSVVPGAGVELQMEHRIHVICSLQQLPQVSYSSAM